MPEPIVFKSIKTQRTYKNQIIKQMKGLSVYKPEFDSTISILADLLFLYYRMMQKFEASGYEPSCESGSGGEKKSPTVATLENLWKNILQYSDRLCLNPKALGMEPEEVKAPSVLETALKDIG